MFFGYTHCPDVCPTTMVELKQMALADTAAKASGGSPSKAGKSKPARKNVCESFSASLGKLIDRLNQTKKSARAGRGVGRMP